MKEVHTDTDSTILNTTTHPISEKATNGCDRQNRTTNGPFFLQGKQGKA